MLISISAIKTDGQEPSHTSENSPKEGGYISYAKVKEYLKSDSNTSSLAAIKIAETPIN